MKRYFIPRKEIEMCHPVDAKYATDADYALFAGQVLTEIHEMAISDMDDSEMRSIAVNLAMYYEDVIADTGLWRSFTDRMHQMYGFYLPFYNIDESQYLRDEPNLADVKFVVWYSMLRSRSMEGRVINPETPVLEEMARRIYRLMDSQFEDMPINEELKRYLAETDFMADFDDFSDVMHWLGYNCWLTSIVNIVTLVCHKEEEIKAFVPAKTKGDSFCTAIQELLFTTRCGPLALRPVEWLSLLLCANGNVDQVQRIEQLEYKSFDGYVVASVKEGVGITLEGAEGYKMDVPYQGGEENFLPGEENAVVFASFVRFSGVWCCNGCCMQASGAKDWFERKRGTLSEEFCVTEEQYERLMKQSGGSPFFYFSGKSQLSDFLVRELGVPECVTCPGDMDDGPMVVGIMPPGTPISMLKSATWCLCDPRNPYYDETRAKRETFSVTVQMPNRLLHYAMDHDMLPYAGIKSVYGEERGRYLFQTYYDFWNRVIACEDFVE